MTRLPVRKYPPDHYLVGDDIIIVRSWMFPELWRVLYQDEVVVALTWLEAWRLVKELIKSPAA